MKFQIKTTINDTVNEYAEKIENSTTIAQDLFDMINATGWALYNGYGMINIYCRNGVSICLQKDLYSDLATDEAQLLQLDGMLQNFTVTVDESRAFHENDTKSHLDEKYDEQYSNALMSIEMMNETGDFANIIKNCFSEKTKSSNIFICTRKQRLTFINTDGK